MSEQPASIAREARSIHQSLKELLKTKEPFDKEVDFQRKNLRKRYLTLLLLHPHGKESKDVENHLWMQTSYAFIALYKQRISAVDLAIQNNQRQHQEVSVPPQKDGNPYHGVVEHRKLVQRFRQFLADEDKFWTQLVLRLLRLFDLQEARPALISLGFLNEADEILAVGTASSDGSKAREDGLHVGNGRNHLQFPIEDISLSYSPATLEERENRLSSFSKALICLGDIARYREQYNESKGRPRAGHDDAVPARRGKGKRGGAPDVVRPRNYDRSRQYYEQAQSLVPHEGNASHQLAILDSYQKDLFSSIVHYYRSLCVRQPYDTAAENLGTVLTKALETWKQKMKREKEKSDMNVAVLAPRVRIELFKEKVVVLHALWRVGMAKGCEKMKSIAPKHNEKLTNDFYSLVSERHLPVDMILNTIVLSQAALWKHRMIRDTPSPHHRRSESDSVSAGTVTLIEWSILDHILDLYTVLLEVGKEELKDDSTTEDGSDLAQRISATFRRTLPALRIASKWLRANFKYLVQDQEYAAFQEKEKLKGLTAKKSLSTKISGFSTKTINFWKAYAAFILALSRAFPTQRLPPLEAPLEEDIEMRGFLPLRNMMGEGQKSGEMPFAEGGRPAREQVHPNVEQLMRIADLLEDAKALVNVEYSPLCIRNNHILFNVDVIDNGFLPLAETSQYDSVDTEVPGQQHLLGDVRNASLDLQLKEDRHPDDMTITSRTDDDPVRDAFQFLYSADDAVDDELEEDEVVYLRSPALSPKIHAIVTTPVKALRSPVDLSGQSPTLYQANKNPAFTLPSPVPQHMPATTAQDLLNDVMGLKTMNVNCGIYPPTESSAPQSKFLFGSELSYRPTQSIWSASRDEQPLMYSANGNTGQNGQLSGVYGGHNNGTIASSKQPSSLHTDINLRGSGAGSQQTTFAGRNSQELTPPQQSIWSYGGNAQNYQQRSVGTLHSTSFAQPNLSPSNHLPSVRYRPDSSNSNTVQPSQLYPNFGIQQTQREPLAYTSPVLHQLPIYQPDPQLSSAYPSSSFSRDGLPTASTSAFGTTTASHVGGGLIEREPGPLVYGTVPGHHSRQVSIHDTRFTRNQNYVSAAVSQTWGHGG